MEKQNTLLLTKNYPPQIGGIEKYAHDLYTKLVSEGTNVKTYRCMTEKGISHDQKRLPE